MLKLEYVFPNIDFFYFEYLIAVTFFCIFLILAFKLKRFKEKGFAETVDYVEYQPPKDLYAYEIGYLVDGVFQKYDIGAAAISFYKKGILTIKPSQAFSPYNNYFELNMEHGIDNDHEIFYILSNNLFNNTHYVRMNITPKSMKRRQKRIENHLFDLGYLQKDFLFKKTFTIILFSFLFIFYLYFVIKNPLSFDTELLFKTSYFMIPVFSVLFYKHKTFNNKGIKVRRELRGYKEYLKKVEKPRVERLLNEFKTPQEKIQKIPHLEYFVAFGLISLEDILN